MILPIAPFLSAPRYDAEGKILYMTHTGTWVMVRRPHCPPFVVNIRTWTEMATEPMMEVAL